MLFFQKIGSLSANKSKEMSFGRTLVCPLNQNMKTDVLVEPRKDKLKLTFLWRNFKIFSLEWNGKTIRKYFRYLCAHKIISKEPTKKHIFL